MLQIEHGYHLGTHASKIMVHVRLIIGNLPDTVQSLHIDSRHARPQLSRLVWAVARPYAVRVRVMQLGVVIVQVVYGTCHTEVQQENPHLLTV